MPLKAEVILSITDLSKYPFIPEALERVKTLGIELTDFTAKPLKGIVERAATYVRAAIDGVELPPPSEDIDEEVLSFALTLLLLKVIGDRMLTRRFAVAFSKRTGAFMAGEDNGKLVYILDKLNLKILKASETKYGYDHKVNIFDYVNNIPEGKGSWKLVHRLVEKGWVYVNKYEAARLGEEALKEHIENKIDEMKIEDVQFPDELYSLIEGLSSEWGRRLKSIREAWAMTVQGSSEEAFPPCIATIISNVKAGKNVPHSARFALASFLLSVGMNVEDVLSVFSSAPDFNEKIARYQVEHIAGRRGSGKKYLPYKCENMRTLGLCVADCKVKHPLMYYWMTLRRRSKKEEK